MADGSTEIVRDVATAPSGETRIDKFNQLVRGAIVLMFTSTICYGFVVSKVVSTETMAVMASAAFAWWFSDPKKATPDKPTNGGA